jgi:hypothetical protein
VPPPARALCLDGHLYHAKCVRCALCQSQIRPTACFVAAWSSDPILYCPECAARVKERQKLCRVCRTAIGSHGEQLHAALWAHAGCKHCYVCSRRVPQVRAFTVVFNKKEGFIVCSDCLAVMNGVDFGERVDSFVGKLIPNILPPTFRSHCRCGKKFKNLVFVCVNNSAVCIDCRLPQLRLVAV